MRATTVELVIRSLKGLGEKKAVECFAWIWCQCKWQEDRVDSKPSVFR